MINYTKEQKEAIEYFDGNLLISASAGSGKTKVLLEKVLTLIKNGVSLSNILMVTFTELAASEMKSKLEDMLAGEIGDNANSGNLIEAFNNINASEISTLHAFCQKMVREYYYILNIEPNFKIAEDNFLTYLKNLALNKTIKEYLLKEDTDFIKISNLFVEKRDYGNFKHEILNFYDFLVSKFDKAGFVDDAIESNYNENLNNNILIEKFRKYFEEHINGFVLELKNYEILAKQINSEKLIQICDSFSEALNISIKNNEDFITYVITKHSFPTISIKKEACFEEVELKEKLQDFSKRVKAFLKEISETFGVENLQELKNDIVLSKANISKFIEIVFSFEKNYSLLKTKNNCLDFNDLEDLTIKLLNNNSVCEEVSNKYRYIFVDEYQDTNNMQETILNKLSNFSNRIMVGDVKQSIYSFRECNPKIFNDKLFRFEKYNEGKVVYLNKNFRSSASILDFSNTIFSNLMKNENCGYNYKTQGMFVCGKTGEKISATQKSVEVYCVDKENTEDVKTAENFIVVNLINNLLNQKIEENGEVRNLTYKDIAIVFRNRNGNMLTLCSLLDEMKIPYNVKYKEQIYQSFEVKLILSYLTLLNNPDNDIELFSVLKNIYKFSANELIELRDNSSSFYGNISNLKENNTKIATFFSDLEEIKQDIEEINLKSLIIKIIKKFDLDVLISKNNGSLGLERLKIFLDSVSSESYSLSDFLSFCRDYENNYFDVSKVSGDNSVYIGTIHSTKGLEYNAVIIGDMGKRIFVNNKLNLVYNANFGIGIKSFDENTKTKSKNAIFSIISKLNHQEEFNEEVRLLYVALTRAKNFMVLVGSEKEKDLIENSNYLNFMSLNSYLKMIYSVRFSNPNFSFNIVSNIDNLTFKENENVDIPMVIDEDLFEIYSQVNSKTYEFNSSTLLQLKNSVTSLSNEDKMIYNISNFKLSDQDREDFVEIGNAYHLALEKLPFSLKNKTEVHNKIINLIENNVVPANIYEYIDDEKIFKAISAIRDLIEDGDKIFKEKVFMLHAKHCDVANSNLEDKVLVQGIIDIYIEKENEIILIDYKTSRLNDVNLIKKYSIQLDLYERALSEIYKNKNIKKYIYSIFLDKLIKIV